MEGIVDILDFFLYSASVEASAHLSMAEFAFIMRDTIDLVDINMDAVAKLLSAAAARVSALR